MILLFYPQTTHITVLYLSTDNKLEVETWHQSFSERERERENWPIGALESCLVCLHHGGFIGSRSGS